MRNFRGCSDQCHHRFIQESKAENDLAALAGAMVAHQPDTTILTIELISGILLVSALLLIGAFGLFTNIWLFVGVAIMLLIQIVYTYLPLMHLLFQSAALGVDSWIRIIFAGFVAFIIVEAKKVLRLNKDTPCKIFRENTA